MRRQPLGAWRGLGFVDADEKAFRCSVGGDRREKANPLAELQKAAPPLTALLTRGRGHEQIEENVLQPTAESSQHCCPRTFRGCWGFSRCG